MAERYFYVRGDERVLLKMRAAPAFALVLLLPRLLYVVAPLAIFLLARPYVAALAHIPATPVLAGAGALALVLALASWRRAATTEYALTDERIYARVGQLVTRLHFTTHDKVTDILYRQGPLERAFGLANLTFATAGGEVHVLGVRDALAVKATAESARDAFVRALLREAPERAARASPVGPSPDTSLPDLPPAPAAPPWTGPRPAYLQAGDTPVWYAQPRLVAAVGALRSLLGIVVVLLFSPMLEGPRRVWIPVAALGIAGMFIAVRFAQLRRTEYVATERRVYARAGLVGTTVNQLTYDKITDITLTQDVLGRILGYGSVVVQTAGGQQAPITMVGLADPLAAKETIERWRDASLGGAR